MTASKGRDGSTPRCWCCKTEQRRCWCGCRALPSTLPWALGPTLELGVEKMLWELLSHHPGDVSTLTLTPWHPHLHLLVGGSSFILQRLWEHTAHLNMQSPTCQWQHQLTASHPSSSFSDLPRQPEEIIHSSHLFVLFTSSGPAVRNSLWCYRSRTLGPPFTWSFLSLLWEAHH